MPRDRPTSAVNLLETWPDLAAAVAPEQRPQAERVLVAPVIVANGADLDAEIAASEGAFNFVIVEGIVLKETVLASRSALEVLTEGDVLAPPSEQERSWSADKRSEYSALGRARVAVLDQRFKLIARRWPEIADFLHARIAEQAHRASRHLATLHIPQAEGRIVMLFMDLAQRVGRVSPEGVVIGIDLTHEAIGRLIGSRRPTVSLALQSLEQQGHLRRADAGWLLPHDAVPDPAT